MIVPSVELLRVENSHYFGVFGILVLQTTAFCVTLEPPDYANIQQESCIPANQYLCSKKVSPKFGHTYEVRHVPNRSNIVFHPGNSVEDTEGCILLGRQFGLLRGNRAILNSGDTFKQFIEEMRMYDTFTLTIKTIY